MQGATVWCSSICRQKAIWHHKLAMAACLQLQQCIQHDHDASKHMTGVNMQLQAPADASKELFLQYASLEEKYGLSRSAMGVYEQAVRTVPLKERFPLYELYLARASEFFGVGKVSFWSLQANSLTCRIILPASAACQLAA